MTKPGRNDPCPCGSGKKYKQCCWNKRLPLGKRPFKATVLSSGVKKQMPDLMERAFGDAIKQGETEGLEKLLKEALPNPEARAKFDLTKMHQNYLEESKKHKNEEESP